mgnify:CR=1 FL=1
MLQDLLTYIIILTPGMHVSVVNSYAAILENTPVSFVRSVLLPTEGNPIIPIRESPLLETSNPS